MNDDDTRKVSAQAIEPQPVDTLYHALTGVQIECAQLVTAIRQRDWEDAQIAAEDAVASYLAAKAACRRLELRSPDAIEAMRAISLALATAWRMVDGVFEHLTRQVAAQPLHKLLRQLRLSLAIANDESPPIDTGTD